MSKIEILENENKIISYKEIDNNVFQLIEVNDKIDYELIINDLQNLSEKKFIKKYRNLEI